MDRVGACVYASNVRSTKALEKSGFKKMESFIEEGVESFYYELAREST